MIKKTVLSSSIIYSYNVYVSKYDMSHVKIDDKKTIKQNNTRCPYAHAIIIL